MSKSGQVGSRLVGHNDHIESMGLIPLKKDVSGFSNGHGVANGGLKPEKKEKITGILILAVAAAVLGSSAQFGFNIGVINNPEGVIKNYYSEAYFRTYNETMAVSQLDFMWSLAVAIFPVGAFIGSYVSGKLADKLGRKNTLLLNNVVAIIAGLLMAISRYTPSYIAFAAMITLGRLIIGVNCGASSIMAPMYLNEISPVKLRGAIGTLCQTGLCTALVISMAVSLPLVLGNAAGWNILLGLTIIPAIFQLVTLPFCPDSPRFLLINRKNEKAAARALRSFRGVDDVADDFNEIREENEKLTSEPAVPLLQMFTKRSLRPRMIIACAMQFAQQLSGINVINFFSTKIYIQAGMPEDMSPYATLGTGCIQLIASIISVPLMERLGRRPMMLMGLAFMFYSAGSLTISLILEPLGWHFIYYVSILSCMVFVVGFSLGPGPIPWTIVGELFSQGPKGTAMAFSGFLNWFLCFVIGFTFTPLLSAAKEYTFLVYMVCLAFAWVFVLFQVPETKNKSINEIVKYFEEKEEKIRDRKERESVKKLKTDEREAFV